MAPSLPRGWVWFLVLLPGACWSHRCAAAPVIRQLSVRGLQIGVPTTVTIEGADLLPDPQVLLPVPIASQSVQPGATAERIVVDITLEDGAAIGIHPLRIVNAHGISDNVLIGIDHLAQRKVHSDVAALPIALHGELTGSAITELHFTAYRGMPLVAEIESNRLGAKLRPVLRLLDESGKQLAWSGPHYHLGGDTRCEIELPADGRYTLQLHDVLYQGAAPGFYRLKIGTLQYADLAYPVGISSGQNNALQFALTNLPADVTVTTSAPSATTSLFQPAPLPSGLLVSGGQPSIVVGPDPELVERPDQSGPQPLPGVPAAVTGRLDTPGQRDQYLLTVSGGRQLTVDVLARRLGSPLDGVLVVRDTAGKQLARSDDRPTTADPGLEVTVPEGTEQLVVVLSDLLGRGGRDFIYRLHIEEKTRPDFELTADRDPINIPSGGTQVVQLQVERRGYDGPIDLAIEDGPPALQLAGQQIPAGDTMALLTVTAPADAGTVASVGRIIARGAEGLPTRVALLPDTPAAQRLPWIRHQIGMAIAPAIPIRLAWEQVTDDDTLLLGTKQPLQVSVQRNEGTAGQVRLRLLTTQPTPTKNVNENNKQSVVADVERSLRLEGDSVVTADATQATTQLLVPADLGQKAWGLVMVGELLAADNQTVIATAATPVRYLTARMPFSVELTGPSDIEARAGEGETGTLTGRITREPQFQQAVTVTLVDLPSEYPAPSVTIPAEQTDFELPVRFPAAAKPAELKDAKLVATYAAIADKPELAVRSQPVPITLRVVAGPSAATTTPEAATSEESAEPKEQP